MISQASFPLKYQLPISNGSILLYFYHESTLQTFIYIEGMIDRFNYDLKNL